MNVHSVPVALSPVNARIDGLLPAHRAARHAPTAGQRPTRQPPGRGRRAGRSRRAVVRFRVAQHGSQPGSVRLEPDVMAALGQPEQRLRREERLDDNRLRLVFDVDTVNRDGLLNRHAKVEHVQHRLDQCRDLASAGGEPISTSAWPSRRNRAGPPPVIGRFQGAIELR